MGVFVCRLSLSLSPLHCLFIYTAGVFAAAAADAIFFCGLLRIIVVVCRGSRVVFAVDAHCVVHCLQHEDGEADADGNGEGADHFLCMSVLS
jgi:hypothetical protein